MTVFNVEITYGVTHKSVLYEIHTNSRPRSLIAARQALKTLEDHGHVRAPFDDGPLYITVTEEAGGG